MFKPLFISVCVINLSKPSGYYIYHQKNENQLDATYYFIVLLIGSTCFGQYYAHHQELATITFRNDQCGNQHYSRELLMMGIILAETC